MAIERMLTEEMPARVLVARALAEAGIEYEFGISGGHTGRIISGLSQVQNQVRMMTVREESLAGVMAEVYGRLTRRPGVMIGQGPGAGVEGTVAATGSPSHDVLDAGCGHAPHYARRRHDGRARGVQGGGAARRWLGGAAKRLRRAEGERSPVVREPGP